MIEMFFPGKGFAAVSSSGKGKVRPPGSGGGPEHLEISGLPILAEII
jgi:hypothetical protein